MTVAPTLTPTATDPKPDRAAHPRRHGHRNLPSGKLEHTGSDRHLNPDPDH